MAPQVPSARAMSRSSTSTRGPAPASKYSTPTARWKHSAGEALVGFGGLAGAVFARRFAHWPLCNELRSISPRADAGPDQPLMMPERLANRTSPSMCRTWDMDEPARDATGQESLGFIGIC
jgi:hypothetical protein